METNATPSSLNRSFWLGKLFSLFGLVPLGVYVFFHLYNNLRSLWGEENFNHHLEQTRALPFIVPIAILGLWVPIAFHGLYGLFVVKKARPQLVRYFLFGNLKYFIQRLSGIGLLFFIPAHIYKTRIDPALSGYVLDFRHMSEAFHEPLTLAVYFLGVLGVAYHLANGIWQFSIGWGIVTTEKGMHRVQIFSYIVFVLLLLMGYGAIGGFYMGS